MNVRLVIFDFVGSIFEYGFIVVKLIRDCPVDMEGQFPVYIVLISGNCSQKMVAVSEKSGTFFKKTQKNEIHFVSLDFNWGGLRGSGDMFAVFTICTSG